MNATTATNGTQPPRTCSVHPGKKVYWNNVCENCAVALSKIEKFKSPMPKPGTKRRRALLAVSIEWLACRSHVLALRQELEEARQPQTLETETGADISQNCTPPGGESSRSRAEPPESDGNTGESDGNSDGTETELEQRIRGAGAENVVKFMLGPVNSVVLTPDIEEKIRTAKARLALAKLQTLAEHDVLNSLLLQRKAGELADVLDDRPELLIASLIVWLDHNLQTTRDCAPAPKKLLEQLAGPMTMGLTTATLKLRRFRDTGLWTAGGEE